MSDKTVTKVREEMNCGNPQLPSPRLGQDGKTRKMPERPSGPKTRTAPPGLL